MGNQQSESTLALKTNFPFGKHSSPQFYLEDYLNHFQYLIRKEFDTQSNDPHTPEQLGSLIVGCYEGIPEIHEVLNAIVNHEYHQPLKYILELERHYINCQNNVKERLKYQRKMLPFIYAQFVPVFSIIKNPTSKIQYPNLNMILNAMESVLTPEKSKLHEISDISNFFRTCAPSSAFPPPTSDFVVQLKGYCEFFMAPEILSRCVTSNGQFLFIATPTNIIIFSILNNGLLSSPIVREIKVKLMPSASLIAGPSTITFCSKLCCHTYDIDLLVHGFDQKPIVSPPLEHFAAAASDGVTVAVLQKDNSTVSLYKNFDFKKPSNIITLHSGYFKVQESQKLPKLVDEWMFSKMMINGAFLSFIINIGPNQYISRVFSLITGQHILDEPFNSPDQIHGICHDAINRCHFSVFLGTSNQFGVRRFLFAGGMDPRLFEFHLFPIHTGTARAKMGSCMETLNVSLAPIFEHYINSKILPPLLVPPNIDEMKQSIRRAVTLVSKINDLPKEHIGKIAGLFSASLLLNILLSHTNMGILPEQCRMILEILPRLPMKLTAFLFFSNFTYFLKADKASSLQILVELFETIQSEKILAFALRQIELAPILASISISSKNPLSDLIPQDLSPKDSITDTLRTLLVIHQRHIVCQAKEFLKKNTFAAIKINAISARPECEPSTPLDRLADYFQIILSKFDVAISSCTNVEDLENSLIAELFGNFLRLLSSITKYHSVAQSFTMLLQVLPTRLASLLKINFDDDELPFVGEASSSISDMFFDLLYIFCEFAATLVRGGTLSEIERKYPWMMKDNIKLIYDNDLMERLTSNETEDSILSLIPLDKVMTDFYTSYKKNFNNRLSDQVKQFDKYTLGAMCKHLNITVEMQTFEAGKKISPALKSALDQMMRVRNEFRSRVQSKKDTTNLITRSLMLLRMNSESATLKSLGDFIIYDEEPTEGMKASTDPEEIKKIIACQMQRVMTTMMGYALIDDIFQNKVHPQFTSIVGYTLAHEANNFETLSQIMTISQLTNQQEQQMEKFFIHLIKDSGSQESFLRIAYRFFRDVQPPEEIRNKIVDIVLRAFQADPKRLPLFALAIQLCKEVSKIPALLRHPDFANPYFWTLLSIVLERIPCPVKMFDNFEPVFWRTPSDMKHIACRLMYEMVVSASIDEERLTHFLKKTLKTIGTNIQSFNELPDTAETIWLARRILLSQSKAHDILDRLIRSITDEAIDEDLISVFSILGSNIEPLRLYSSIMINQTSYLSIPDAQDDTQTLLFEIPFKITREHQAQKISPNSGFAIPQITIPSGPYDDLVLSFFARANDGQTPALYSVYLQTIAHFAQYEDFCKKLTDEMIIILSLEMLPFHDIPLIQAKLEANVNSQATWDNNGFSILQFDRGVNFTSYLSPQLREVETNFDIKINITGEFYGYIGFVTDTAEKLRTRYSLIHFPTARTFPNATSNPTPFEPTSTIMVVLTKDYMLVSDRVVPYPVSGDKFRVIVSVKNETQVYFETDDFDSHFDTAAIPEVEKVGCSERSSEPIYREPQWVSMPNLTLKPQICEAIPPDFVKDISDKEKLGQSFLTPPDYIIIHPGFSTCSSELILKNIFNGLFTELGMKWASIAMAYIARWRASSIPAESVPRLFSILAVSLEPFFIKDYMIRLPPIRLNQSFLSGEQCRPLFGGMERVALLALNELAKVPEAMEELVNVMEEMSNSIQLNLIAHPHLAHSLYHVHNGSVIKLTSGALVTLSSFKQMDTSITCNGSLVRLPTIGDGEINCVTHFDGIVSYLKINDKPEWIWGSVWELIVLMKDVLQMTEDSKLRQRIKLICYKLYIINSPHIALYTNQLLQSIILQVPPSPFNTAPEYIKSLALLSAVASKRGDNIAQEIYQSERSVLTSPLCQQLAPFFPEFFGLPLPPPKEKVIHLPLEALDPGAITKDFKKHIQRIQYLTKTYHSLHGFPFWELYSYWVRLSNVQIQTDNKDFVKPYLELQNRDAMHDQIYIVHNPAHMEVKLILKVKTRISIESFIMTSEMESFADCEFIPAQYFAKPIIIKGGDTFVSLSGTTWNNIDVQLVCQEEIRQHVVDIDVQSTHDQFVTDMKDFVLNWTDEMTNQLIDILPDSALSKDTFTDVFSIAKGSNLAMTMSPTAVALRALFIHHFNFIKERHQNEVPEQLWEEMNNLTSCEKNITIIQSKILSSEGKDYPILRIDRHAAHTLILNKKGSHSDTIVAQVAKGMSRVGVEYFRNKERPWKVEFVQEMAIDAGGPMRELLTEFCSSIFEPTTQMFIPTPNGQRSIGAFKDCYVPFTRETTVCPNEYTAIGSVLGIISRTGLSQDLPFAPLVWKYIAGGNITEADLCQVDEELAKQFRDVRAGNVSNVAWAFTNWDGAIEPNVNGHKRDDPITDIDLYITEYVRFRLKGIETQLKHMRNGFISNIGISEDGLLTGPILSRMTQGSGIISVEHMKSITLYFDYEGGAENEVIQRYWRAVERFTQEQLKLLLKFITTLTRLPNTAINPSFKLKIDRMPAARPDQTLPTASTCFNRLHLPAYTSDKACYDKLLYAAMYCQTMENK